MKKLGRALVALACSVVLVGCGGGGSDSTPLVASANTTAPVNASSSAALTSKSFSFPNGVSALGTSSPTTLTFNSPSTFSVTSSEGEASGSLSYGSCIFKATTSTFPVGSKLERGASVEISPCDLKIPTAGMTVDGAGVAKLVALLLGTDISAGLQLTVDINSSGQVVVNGIVVATVTLTPVTGGTGG